MTATAASRMIEITSIRVEVYHFLGKANMGWCSAHVRFWPIASIIRRLGFVPEKVSYVAGGVPMLRRFATAVTSCAGAKGFVMRVLLGTPCDAH